MSRLIWGDQPAALIHAHRTLDEARQREADAIQAVHDCASLSMEARVLARYERDQAMNEYEAKILDYANALTNIRAFWQRNDPIDYDNFLE